MKPGDVNMRISCIHRQKKDLETPETDFSEMPDLQKTLTSLQANEHQPTIPAHPQTNQLTVRTRAGLPLFALLEHKRSPPQTLSRLSCSLHSMHFPHCNACAVAKYIQFLIIRLSLFLFFRLVIITKQRWGTKSTFLIEDCFSAINLKRKTNFPPKYYEQEHICISLPYRDIEEDPFKGQKPSKLKSTSLLDSNVLWSVSKKKVNFYLSHVKFQTRIHGNNILIVP